LISFLIPENEKQFYLFKMLYMNRLDKMMGYLIHFDAEIV